MASTLLRRIHHYAQILRALVRLDARLVDVGADGERHAHAAMALHPRLREDAQIGARCGECGLEVREFDFAVALDDDRMARRAVILRQVESDMRLETGIPSTARACRSNSLKYWLIMVTMPVSCGRRPR